MKQHNPHTDYFGTPVNVGDLVLGAKAQRNQYQDTEYCFSVVVAKTKGMIRLHQLGKTKATQSLSSFDILNSVKERAGKKGGRMLASNVIKLGRNCGFTEKEFDEAINKGATQALTSSPFIFP